MQVTEKSSGKGDECYIITLTQMHDNIENKIRYQYHIIGVASIEHKVIKNLQS